MSELLKKIKRLFARKGITPVDPAKRRLILVVDDDNSLRHFIQRVMEKRGHRVVTAANGEEGVAAALRYRPDLILLDHVMPGMKGPEVCRRLRDENLTRDIPVIFLSSHDDPDSVINHFELGDIHLSKPIDARELILQAETTLAIGE